MATDTYTPRLGLIEIGTGNQNNSWGTTFNNSFALIVDRAIAGINIITATGGTVDLSGSPPPAGARQDIDAWQTASGALTSDLTIIVPMLSKISLFGNFTTGNFNMYVKVAGTSNPVQIPQGLHVWVAWDSTGAIARLDRSEVGAFRISGKASAGPGELLCNGASLLRTSYPDLYNAIGTTWGSADATHFTLPLLTDTGRFLRSSSGSLAVGTYQSNLVGAHTHGGASFSGTTSGDSNDHTHAGSGTTSGDAPDHTHTLAGYYAGTTTITASNYVAGPIPGGATVNPQTGGASARHTHTYSFTTGGISAAHTHTYTGTTGTIPSAGGAETRPESAVVLMCIRY